MSGNEWAFLVRSEADLFKVQALANKHNERGDVGDPLESIKAVKYNGYYFWVLKNKGGEYATSAFIGAYISIHEKEMMLFWPRQVPDDWSSIPKDEMWFGDACYRVLSDCLPLEPPSSSHPWTRSAPDPKIHGTELSERFKTPGIPIGPVLHMRREYISAPCYACGKITGSRCAKCKSAFACNRACQVADWPLHRVNCKKYASNNEMIALWAELFKDAEARDSK